jgi:predicted dehydrogenase
MEESLDPVLWGVLSTARIGTERVIPAMASSELSRVVAIASRDPERAAEAKVALGLERAYGSYEEMLADPEIEAVYNPLPNHLHLEWTVAAAEAGKHVLCEKPLAMSSAEARTMIESCERAGVKLMEAFMYRLHPLWTETKRIVDEGEIGELQAIQVAFSYFNDDPTNIRNIPEVGGGALYDIGCYAISASRFLFGSEPTQVKAVLRRDVSLGTDVVTGGLLDFDGRIAGFVCSTQAEPDQRVDVYGTKGRLTVEIPFNIPPDRVTRLLRFAGGTPPTDPHVVVHEIAPADQYALQADAFSRAIRNDTPVPTPVEDAVANLEVIEAIFADATG